jgi:hypothetical protein
MAKKTTTHEFYVVDLIRKKPATTYLEIPKYRVDVSIEVTASDPVPESKLKRLEEAARGKLDEYEKVIAEETKRLDGEIAKLMAAPSKANLERAQQMIGDANTSIAGALRGAENAADAAVQARLKKEAQGDKLLKEARVKTGVKVTVGIIKVGGSVAKLVATAGAELTSYKTIVVELVRLGLELNQQLKNEEKLRTDLVDGVQSYITLRGNTIMQAASRQGITDTSGISVSQPLVAVKALALKAKAMGNEVTKGRDAKQIATELLDFVVKGIKAKLGDAEKARKAYREHTTKTRQRTDGVSAKADKLAKAMKSAKTLKEGVKVGAECMRIKAQVSAMAAKLDQREKFLDEMQALMKGNGLSIDDRTTLQKLAALDKTTIIGEANSLKGGLVAIKGLVDNVLEAAA